MASGIYPSFIEDICKGNINPQSDTFRVMIVGSGYTPVPATHTKRSDITSEISASGYTAGGEVVDISVTRSGFEITITIPATQWASIAAGATGRRAIVYKARGGAASADELVCCIDPGGDRPTNGTSYTVSLATQPKIVVTTWS